MLHFVSVAQDMNRKEQQRRPVRITLDYLDGQIAMAEAMIADLHGHLQRLLAERQRLRSAPIISSKAKAIDAVELYLKEQGEPKSRAEIIETMVEWGVNSGTRSQRAHIEMSIDYNLLPAADKKKKWPKRTALQPRLKYFGKLIGLPEWEE